ncbi:MAG: amidohydrolase family protein [Thermoprotei archaeon]
MVGLRDEYQIIGKAFINNAIIDNAVIRIKDDKIIKVSKKEERNIKTLILKNEELIIPATIDLHVHLRDWEQSYKEDIESGTKAALKGGCTTIVEMPNTLPPINTSEKLEQRLEMLHARSRVDFGVHFGVPNDLSELAKVAKKIIAIKVYPNDLHRIHEIFYSALQLNLKVAVHAEFKVGDEPLAVNYVLSNKPRMLSLRFVHVSREGSLKIISHNKDKNTLIEVTPHHLLLSYEELQNMPNGMKYCRPPISSINDKKALYDALISGFIDFIATDHAPHLISEKLSENPAPGFPGLEISLPLMITQWIKDLIPLSQVIKTMCINPARYLGIQKGIINEGFYADLTVVNLKTWKPVKASDFISKAKYTPFEGWLLTGWPTKVFLRGLLAYEDGEIFLTRGKHVLDLR